MNPGKLDRRITFGTFVSTENANQDYTFVFTPVLTTWAHVKPYSGRRQLEAGEQVITEGTEFIIRYRPDFTPTKNMRALYLGKYYTIHSVRDIDNEHRFYEVLTKVTDENSDAGT